MLKKLRLLTVELGLARTCVTVSSSVEGLVVGNMMQSVVLDGNPLNEDEDM